MFKNFGSNSVYIIAEIGGNFTTLEDGIRLIDLAAECKCDAVKLQTYKADTISSKRAIFDMENTGIVSQHELFKKYELSESLHNQIFKYAEEKGLDWFSTPSHTSDVDLLERCGVGAHKIGSDDATNIPFLKYVAETGKPILLSTGMCTLAEVHEAVNAILSVGNSKLMLLHAITSYPTHAEDVNLRAIQTLKKAFPDLQIGYSDHTMNPLACLYAAAMGATIIEKHFTYDKNADGPDHQLSADPEEMNYIVKSIRNLDVLAGTGIKLPAASEKTTRINNRKSLIAARHISKGSVISENDVVIKRPGTGIPPTFLDQVIGRTVGVDLNEDDVINWSSFC